METQDGVKTSNRYRKITFLIVSFLFILIFFFLVYTAPRNTKKLLKVKNINVHKWKSKTSKSTSNMISKSTGTLVGKNDRLQNIELKNATLLTLFTTWKTDKEKYTCRNNTVKNWASLISFGVKPVLFSNEPDLRNRVNANNWDVLRPKLSSIGVPILKHMYMETMKRYNSSFYAFANGDILFTKDLIKTLQFILSLRINKPMLVIGQRINVQNVSAEQASSFESIISTAKTGELNYEWGIDYFITNSIYPWIDCPEMVIGRVLYDNWLVLNARKHEFVTIDATDTLLALHQTTKAGNDEGRGHSNSNYNGDLLSKMYRNIHYKAGRTSCATFYTTKTIMEKIKLQKRIIPRNCFPL